MTQVPENTWVTAAFNALMLAVATGCTQLQTLKEATLEWVCFILGKLYLNKVGLKVY